MKPILYADIFDFPLTFEEIYRFLEFKTSPQEVKWLLGQAIVDRKIILVDGYYSLSGKPHLAAKRKERFAFSQTLWPEAIRYGRWIASMPFVRLVAITGSLAVENPRNNVDDIDYFVVTDANRLWLCRAMIILLVRFARRRNVHLCPNYLLTERLLFFKENNLYTAREMLQMVPLYGKDLYLKMRLLNTWVTNYLPQGTGLNLDKVNDNLSVLQSVAKKVGEFILGGIIGDLLEKVLRKYQITKHTRIAEQVGAVDKVVFTADECKGHFDNHGHKTLQAYRHRVNDQY
ncbi:MAG: hypothetical protein ACE5H9_20245, partial [Anaerolineae bacterium]